MDETLVRLVELVWQHKGKLLGALAGFFLAWFIVAYGLFKTAFVVLCLIVGLILGKQLDDGGFGGQRSQKRSLR